MKKGHSLGHGFFILLTCFLFGLKLFEARSQAQTAHTEAYLLGVRIEQGFRNNDVSAFAKAFDVEMFLNRITDGMPGSDDQKQNIRKGIRSRLEPTKLAEAAGKSGKELTFVGVRSLNNEYQLLFRSNDAKDAITYFGYTLAQTPQGGTAIADIFYFAPGITMSEVARRGYVLALTAIDRTAIDSLSAKQKDFVNSQAEWNAFLARCESQKFALVVAAYSKLPLSLQQDKFALFNRTRAALGEDEKTFLEAIAPWQQLYPNDPVLERFVGEYYWDKDQNAKAMASFERLNKLLGGDADLDLRISKIHQGLGQTNEAKACLWEAVKRDPPDAKAFAAMLKSTLAEKKFDESARVLSIQEMAFRTDLKPLVKSDATYEEFRKSAAYQIWLKAPPAQPLASENLPTTAKPDADSFKLQGIMFTADPSAFINGKTVFVGDKIGAYKVTKIEQQSVTLQSPSGQTKVLTSKPSP
ncbi:MAG: hypothetical protein JWR26_2310 [Pedosphaera sp.]|nr:hypothetical protein [Pedosphaera sp.]